MRVYLTLGATPAEEPCAQVGTPGYEVRAMAESRRYVQVVRHALGPEPPGARLRVKEFPHDLGSYLEVVVEYDAADEAATEYAHRCEAEAPARWPRAITP